MTITEGWNLSDSRLLICIAGFMALYDIHPYIGFNRNICKDYCLQWNATGSTYAFCMKLGVVVGGNASLRFNVCVRCFCLFISF